MVLNNGVPLAANSTTAEVVAFLNKFIDDFESTDILTSYAMTSDADQIWILIAGFLVFFMHTGFAMLETGSVRHKNAVNILFKNVGNLAISGWTYYIFGYAFAYGVGNEGRSTFGFIGSGNYALSEISNDDRHLWFFQWAFAATAATIVSGAVAGRVNLVGFFIMAGFLTAFVYPVVSHWIWATGGWASAFTSPESARLFQRCGMIDYAGSGVVHMTGGIAALWGSVALGPRIGRFADDGTPVDLPPHNLSLVALGTLILWFGWYGFNVGSTLAFDGNVASKVAVTTTLSPAASGLTSIILSRGVNGHYDLPMALNSLLAGLVGITAGCSVVEDWAALIIGIISCFVYVGSSKLMLILKIDDPVDAFSVHGSCGLWGVLAVGIFATPTNILNAYGSNCAGWEDGWQFLSQLVGALAIIGWVTLWMVPFFVILHFIGMWRVSADMEKQGLDSSEHGGQRAFIGSDSLVKGGDVEKGQAQKDDAPKEPVQAEGTPAAATEAAEVKAKEAVQQG